MPQSPLSSRLGLEQFQGPWTKQTTTHLLNRVLFGAKHSEIQSFLAKGLVASVTELLNPVAPFPTPPLNEYNTATVVDPAVAPGNTWINNPTNDGTINSLRRNSYKKWLTGVMIHQDLSIREKMTLFWGNHFGTEADTISNANYVYQHHDTIRKNALGNFKTMVKAITIDPGMLRYLNGYLNTASAPDENYGRELQELFTVGKDNSIQYSESDVKAAARVLTGWRINASYTSYFDATRHDTGNKQFSSYYNNKVITGKTGQAGATETDELIDMLFEKEDMAKYICRRIYRWFVYYYIDETVEKNIITPLAVIFKNNNFEIKPVLSALLNSAHFYDPIYIGCQIKSPFDHVLGTLRKTNVVFPNAITDYADAYVHFNNMVSQLISFGQNPVDPPNVAGWPAYYQSPEFYELWINADTLPKRNKFTDLMIETGYTRNGRRVIIDTISFAKSISSNPADPNQLIQDVFDLLISTEIDQATKDNLKKQILLSGQTSDYYWTDAWNNYKNNQTTINFNLVNNRLKALIKYIMNLPDYQLS
jgi:uncharacterized protein (DUF1800 family)